MTSQTIFLLGLNIPAAVNGPEQVLTQFTSSASPSCYVVLLLFLSVLHRPSCVPTNWKVVFLWIVLILLNAPELLKCTFIPATACRLYIKGRSQTKWPEHLVHRLKIDFKMVEN